MGGLTQDGSFSRWSEEELNVVTESCISQHSVISTVGHRRIGSCGPFIPRCIRGAVVLNAADVADNACVSVSVYRGI